MVEKVRETINKNKMIKAGDKVICALSGGADSMGLLCALFEIKDEIGFSLFAANLNHSIRGEEGDNDSLFAEKFCNEIGVEIFTKKVDVPAIAKTEGIGEEECGRRERYKFFDEIVNKLGGGIIATGHHKGDNAETVLFNLFRGSGLRGLGGIRPKRDNVIRPLIDVSKKEICDYLTKKGVRWCEDSTNKETEYTRNRIRLVILKEIEKAFPEAVNKIANTARMVQIDDDYLNLLAEQSGAFFEGAILKECFVTLHESIRRRIIIKALKEWGAGSIESEKIKAVYETVMGDTGKCRDIGNGVRIVNSYGRIYKEKECEKPRFKDICVKVGENRQIVTSEGVWSIKTVDKNAKMRDNKMMILLDADKMGEEVTIRYRNDGDYINPTGMKGGKKIKKVFIDLKIPQESRDKISLLTEGSEVLFIPKIRKTRKYCLDENTKRVFVAQYREK